MRRRKLLLLLCFIGANATSLWAQSAKISLNLANVPVEQVLNAIEAQSEYTFLYNSTLIDVQRTVSVSANDAPVFSVLNQVFAGTEVRFKIEKRQIILTLAPDPNELQTLSGTVVDEAGEPIIGASVAVKGTSAGTVSNLDGKFELKFPAGEKTIIEISYIGYLTQRITAENRTFINVTLKEQSKALDELIVIGYGTMKKSDVNAAIVSVKGEEINKVANTSVTQMLAGKAAGMTVTDNSLQPGGAGTILIRGAGSVGAGNDPLYVIDGFPISNSSVEPRSGNRYSEGSRNILNSLNPNDIESIEILKDASATAIYGSRACNGVILITTKRGKGNTVQVNYNGDFSVQTIAKRPEMLNARELKIEHRRYLYEEYLNRYSLPPYGDRDPSTVTRPFVVPDELSDEAIAATGAGTDWYGEITQLGRINQHNLSVNAGNDNTKVYLSLNYFDQEGVIKTSGLQRYVGRLNLDQKLASWFNYGLSLSGSHISYQNAALGGGTNENSGIIQSALQYNPSVLPIRDENGEYILNPDQALIPNPLSFLDITDNTLEKTYFVNAYTNINFTKEMFLKLTAGFNDQRGVRKNYLPVTFMYGKGQNGVANINDLSKTDYLTEATFNYHKLFKDVHDIHFLLGSSYQVFVNDGMILYAYDFFTDAFKYNKLSVGEGMPGIDSSAGKSKMASYFTRLQYNFNRKYLFTFTMRADGSDKFGRNNRYGFFPSGAFAWRVIEEPFMKSQPVVSDLKLRVSLGQTGNANIGNSAYEFFDAQGRNYYFGGKENTGVNISQLPNPNLKWETTTEINFGLDYGFFNNRINGNVEVYYKQISDLLGKQALSGDAILDDYPANMGKTESRGVEISLMTANVIRPFTWNSTFTFTAYRDNWLERSPDYVLKPYESEHDPLTAVYGFIPEGIIQAGETVDYMPQAKPGMMKIKNISGLDANGKKDGIPDNTINEADMVYLGHNAPDFTIGFNNEFTYKGFDLNFFIYGSDGAMRWPSVRYAYGTDFEILKIKTGNNFETSIKDRWTSDNQSSTMPSGMRNPYLLAGHYAHEKTWYIRMKNMSLGYDLNRLAKIRGVGMARLSFNMTNLFTLTNFSGIDPETENHSAPYPLQRTYSVALNLSF